LGWSSTCIAEGRWIERDSGHRHATVVDGRRLHLRPGYQGGRLEIRFQQEGADCCASSACVKSCKQASCAERWGSKGKSLFGILALPQASHQLTKLYKNPPALFSASSWPRLPRMKTENVLCSNRGIALCFIVWRRRRPTRPSGAAPPHSPIRRCALNIQATLNSPVRRRAARP
jgi:hypothetical protein